VPQDEFAACGEKAREIGACRVEDRAEMIIFGNVGGGVTCVKHINRSGCSFAGKIGDKTGAEILRHFTLGDPVGF
jgi:hypothetical protein